MMKSRKVMRSVASQSTRIFPSLNLAQAVLLTAYCWFEHDDVTPEMRQSLPNTRPANRGELNGMFDHLENALDHSGFLLPERRNRP